MTRFFCCCLPVRLGVFVLSFLQLLLGGAEAGLIWHSISQGQVEGVQRIAFMVLGGVCSLLALAAFLGLCGSVTRSRTLVTIYATVLYILLALTLGSGVWFAYTLFTDRGDSWMSSCRVEGQNIKDAQLKSIELSSGGFDKALDGICDALLKTFRVVYIVVLVIVFLVQLYCAHIVRNYAEQLSEEEASRHNAASKVYISQPQPQMVHAVPIHYGGYNQDGYYGGNHSRHGSSEKMLHHSSV